MSAALVSCARPRSAAALVLAGVLWGTGGLSGALLASWAGLHPLSVAAYRLLLGGSFAVLLLAVTGRLGGLPRSAAAVRRVVVAGALLAQFQASYFAAVALTSVSIATMVTIGSVPVLVALAGALRRRSLPDPVTMLSVGAAVVGLVLLTWSPQEQAAGWRLPAGLGCALLAGAGFATLTVVTGRPVAGLDPVRTTAFGCLAGGLLLLPVALCSGIALPARADVVAAALYLGAVPTALAYAAYFRGLRDASPVLAALSALLEPLTAALLAAVLFGERLGVTGWTGAALLVAALAAGYLRPPRPAALS
jgi:DME family drug/metabolite transporter